MLLMGCSVTPEIRYKTVVKTEYKKILPPAYLLFDCDIPSQQIFINEDLVNHIQTLYKTMAECNGRFQLLRELSND